jgi:hypothetical protein
MRTGSRLIAERPVSLSRSPKACDDLLAAARVGRRQVGDDETDVGQLVLADGDQQVGQRSSGDHREVRVADGLGFSVLEVRGQLVQQDQERVALEQVDPGGLAGGGQRCVVIRKLPLLAELGGDGAPDAQRGIALAAGEGNDAHRPHVPRGVEAVHDRDAVLWVFGKQTKGHQAMGLAAAHGLSQFEDTLGRLAFQPPETLGQQDPHALGGVVLAEKGRRVDPVLDQVGEVEDGVAARLVEDAFAGCTGFGECLHWSLCHGERQPMDIVCCNGTA